MHVRLPHILQAEAKSHLPAQNVLARPSTTRVGESCSKGLSKSVLVRMVVVARDVDASVVRILYTLA